MTGTTLQTQPDHVPSEGVGTFRKSALEAIQALRHSAACNFTPAYSGNEGQARCDSFYEAYEAVRKLSTTALSSSAAAGSAGEDDKRLRSSDQLRILAGYHGDKLPKGVGEELCDLADEWDDQVDELRFAQNAPTPTEASRSETGRHSDLLGAFRRALNLPGVRKVEVPMTASEAAHVRDLLEAAALTDRPVGEDALREAALSAYEKAHGATLDVKPESWVPNSVSHAAGIDAVLALFRTQTVKSPTPENALRDALGRIEYIATGRDHPDSIPPNGYEIRRRLRSCAEAARLALIPSTSKAAPLSDQGDGWSRLDTAEVVRRTRCEADERNVSITARNAWRRCCDAILKHLAPTPADDTAREGTRDPLPFGCWSEDDLDLDGPGV
jgi:hypothetical protein